MKIIYAIILFLTPMAALSLDYPTMDEFYKNPENEKMLTSPSIPNYFELFKDNLKKECLEKNKEDSCACAVDFITTKVSLREFYYESILANQIFKDKVEAVRSKNDDKKKQLDAYSSNRNSMDKRIEIACPGLK